MIDLIETKRDELRALCEQFCVSRLEVFGSAVDGGFDPDRSDLDFLVSFLPLPPGKHADSYFGLLIALEDLFGRRIDLVEDQTISNPYFREEIDLSRTELYVA